MNLINQVEKNEDGRVENIENDAVQQTYEKAVTVDEATEEKKLQEEHPEQELEAKRDETVDSVSETQVDATPELAEEEIVPDDAPSETMQPADEESQPETAPGEIVVAEEEAPQPETETMPHDEKKSTPCIETEKSEELARYEETLKDYKPGEIIKGQIVSITDNEVLVDIGYKSEGSISLSEFSDEDPPEKFSEIYVFYEKSENADGKVILSKKKADFHLALDKMNQIFNDNETVSGVIRRRIRGGMIADIMGIEAFLPGSQISNKPLPNLDHFIGKEMTFKIINLDKEKQNIIVSRRKVIEEEKKEKIAKLMDKIFVGAELDGEVKNITDYGAFVDLGGLDGLLHITDMTWGQINHPSEMLNISDKVKVKVIDYKPEEERISLGLKQLVPHPWENIEAKYEEGTKVTCKVVNLTPYGAFVELEPGVEGLVHVTEMSWTKKVSHPKSVLKIGDVVDAIVLYSSREDKRISLGIKQMEPNPWLTIDERYPEGTVVKGNVKSITSFGIFIELEEDIDGLVHISDISWTKRITHPKEVFKKGQEVEAAILSIDKHLHRIAMGIKQLEDDPWLDLDNKLPVNTEVHGTISAIISKGVLVQVDVDNQVLEGFVPVSHLAIPRLDKPELAFSVGDVIPMKVIELDMENRRLIFSVKAFLFSKDREVLREFIAKYEPSMKKQAERKEESKKRKDDSRRRRRGKHRGEAKKQPRPSQQETQKPIENIDELRQGIESAQENDEHSNVVEKEQGIYEEEIFALDIPEESKEQTDTPVQEVEQPQETTDTDN